MDQVLRFLGFLVLGIAGGLEFISFASIAMIEGWVQVAEIFEDPINIAIILAFYIPGAVLYGIGAWMRPKAPERTQKKA